MAGEAVPLMNFPGRMCIAFRGLENSSREEWGANKEDFKAWSEK